MNIDTPSWDDLRILLAVHRNKSFLAAGQALGVATSTIARRIEALEKTVGRPLVHRGNAGTVLDSDALRLVALGEELELGLAALRRDDASEPVSGTVRVSLSEGLVRAVTQLLARLRVRHPALTIELMSESRVVDLARREADIGVRIAKTSSPTVISRFMGRGACGLFASRDYLQRRLPNARLARAQAGHHDWICMNRELERMPHERWIRAYGATRFVFRSNSAIGIEQAVLSGMGVGLLSEHQATSVEGLEDAPPPVELFLAYHRDAKKLPRVQAVVQELEAGLRRHLTV